MPALINGATRVDDEARPARGNPREFDKHVWRIPVPVYDPADPVRQDLVAVAVQPASVAADVESTSRSFQLLGRTVRRALVDDGIANEVDRAVGQLLV